jgi:hypothetical protein
MASDLNFEKAKNYREFTIRTPFLDYQLLGMTTIIECGVNNTMSQGSGFFYNQLAPFDTNKGGHWRLVEGMWLITNRHVVLMKINGKEILPDYFTFNLREQIDDQCIEWFPITLSKDEMMKRLRLHQNETVDVVAIDIKDLLKTNMYQSDKHFIGLSSLTNDSLPISSPIPIDVTSDVVIASYPRGFYDEVNKFPIIKSGIIASSWGLHFNGQPFFLVDAKLFPGSSGGLVISKPTNIALIKGELMKNENKDFVFLGVYSGENLFRSRPIEFDGVTVTTKESFGLGNVWYSYLIPEIIENGIAFQ